MWIFLSDAMLSIVAHRDRPEMLLVRARRREDLDRHFPSLEPLATPQADYPWRVEVGREEIAAWLAARAVEISYDNFKNSVGERERLDAYHDVHARMARFAKQE